jgi:hypothetical protein
MMNRLFLSGSFAQLSRSLLAVTKLKDDDSPHAKTMFQVKSNLPSYPATLGDSIP